MSFRKPLLAMAPSVWAFCATVPAILFAADAGAAEPPPTGAGVIEEIVVTSRREEESIQDVPVAVSAFTLQDLTRIAPNTLRDLDGLSPNVFIGQQTAGPSMGAIYIRGLGYADVEKTQAPQVGVIVDGIYQGTNTGQLVDMFDVAQVEIDRGPQGVLYGKNTTGGMITVSRIKPVLDEWHYSASVEGGNYDTQVYKGRVNIPIGDQLALKLGGMSNQQDGFWFDNTRQKNVGDTDYQTGTAALLWQPSESFSATFTYDLINDNSDVQPSDPLYNGSNRFKTSADLNASSQYDVNSESLDLVWDAGFGTITSLTGYVDEADKVLQDFDGGANQTSYAAPLSQLHTLRDQDYTQFSQELRLNGNITDNISYLVGGFYFSTKLHLYQGTNATVQFANPTPIPNVLPALPCEALGFLFGGVAINTNPTFDNLCQWKNSVNSAQKVTENVNSSAAFGQVKWRVIDSVELAYGLRYISENSDFNSALYNAPVPYGSIKPPQPSQVVGAALPGFPLKSNNDWTKTVNQASATWTVTDANTLYARFSQGFRSGGFSLRTNTPEFASFRPEKANAYEIGSKNDLWGDRWRLNLAAFWTRQKDAQFSTVLQTPTVAPGTNTIINNGGESDIYGFEVESTVIVTDHLTFVASYGEQSSNSKDFSISSQRYPFPGNDGTPFQGQSCNAQANPNIYPNCPDVPVQAGNLFRFPHSNWSLSGIYDQEIGSGELTAAVSWHGMEKFFIDSIAGKAFYQPRYNVVDTNVAYQWHLSNGNLLKLSLIGKNILDEEYLNQQLYLGGDGSSGTGLSGFQGWGAPRTWAVELLYQN